MKTLVAIIRPPVGLSKYYTIKWASRYTTLLRPHVSYFTFSPSNGSKTRGGGRQMPPTLFQRRAGADGGGEGPQRDRARQKEPASKTSQKPLSKKGRPIRKKTD